jgi:UDP-glucose 4-epimerase
VLRVARFFAESDDDPGAHGGRCDANVKADEYASRRVALDDAIDAHLLAAERAPDLGFARYVVSATTPFTPDDLPQLRTDAAAVFARRAPRATRVWADRGWRFPSRRDRDSIAETVAATGDVATPWGRIVGSKPYAESGYLAGVFTP